MSGRLDHSQADIIGQLLVDLGHGVAQQSGLTTSWQVYCNYEPDAPDDSITVNDTDGRQGGRLFDGETQVQLGFQVRVRSGLQTNGRGKIEDIKEAFDKEVLNTTVLVDETWYAVFSIQRTTEVIRLGVDSVSRRLTWVLNAVTAIRKLDDTGTATPTLP